MAEHSVLWYSQCLNNEQFRIILKNMTASIQAKLKGQVADDYYFLKSHFGTETETDTVRVIVRELARMLKEQLPKKEPSEQEIEAL